MRRNATCLVFGSVALAACDSGRSPPAPEASATMVPVETPLVPEPSAVEVADRTAPPQAVPVLDDAALPEPTLFNLPDVPAGDVAENRAALTAIPARFLGQWDAPEGPCAPESEMFLTIRPGTISFHESQGAVGAIRRGKPGIVVRLEMEGEGESWTSEYALSLVRNSEQLAMREAAMAGPATIRRRCPPERGATGS